MKNLLFSCIALLLALHVSAQKTTTTRTLSSFKHIAISGGFDKVLLKEGTEESITLELSGIDADKIKTEVKGNTLEIGVTKGWHGDFKATLTVVYRSIDEISNSGSSDIEALTSIKGEAFKYRSSGSGDFKGTFEVKKLSINISGSGDVQASGSADRQEYAISGSGDVKADKLKGKSADVAISGSGDVVLNVDGPVKTAVSGSGSVDNRN